MSIALHAANLAGIALPNRGGFAVRRALARLARVKLSPGVRLATGVRIYDRYLEIGADTWIGMDCRLISCSFGTLRIGSRVDIAPMCVLSTGTHEIGEATRRAGPGKGEDIIIGDGCWVGMASIILAGAEIGPGAVVAAGSVVTKGRYSPNSLIAGVPARIIRSLDAV